MEIKTSEKSILDYLKGKGEIKSQEPKIKVSPIKGKIRVRKRYEKKPKWYNYEEVKDKVVKRNGRWYWREEIETKTEEPKSELKSEEIETKTEEPKLELKSKETPDNEAEKIKEKIGKISESEFLKSEEPKTEEPKPEPKEKFNVFNFLRMNDTWLWVIGIIAIIWGGMKFLSGKSFSSTQPISENKKEEPKIEWEERNIAPLGFPPKIIRRRKI